MRNSLRRTAFVLLALAAAFAVAWPAAAGPHDEPADAVMPGSSGYFSGLLAWLDQWVGAFTLQGGPTMDPDGSALTDQGRATIDPDGEPASSGDPETQDGGSATAQGGAMIDPNG